MKFTVVEIRPTDADRHEHGFLKAGAIKSPHVLRLRSDSPDFGDLLLSCSAAAASKTKVGDKFDFDPEAPVQVPPPAPEPASAPVKSK